MSLGTMLSRAEMVALLAAARLLHLSINLLMERVSFCPPSLCSRIACATLRTYWMSHFAESHGSIPSLVKMPRDWRVWVNDSRVCSELGQHFGRTLVVRGYAVCTSVYQLDFQPWNCLPTRGASSLVIKTSSWGTNLTDAKATSKSSSSSVAVLGPAKVCR